MFWSKRTLCYFSKMLCQICFNYFFVSFIGKPRTELELRLICKSQSRLKRFRQIGLFLKGVSQVIITRKVVFFFFVPTILYSNLDLIFVWTNEINRKNRSTIKTKMKFFSFTKLNYLLDKNCLDIISVK